MNKKIEILRAELAQTKVDLKEKASEFESRLREDVTSAKDSVEGAILNVQSVAAGLSLTKLVQKRPLLMISGSVVSGIVVGSVLAPKSRVNATSTVSTQKRPSLTGLLTEKFPEETRLVKTMAASYVVSLMAKKAKMAFPDFVEKISEFEERITTAFETNG